MNATPTTAAYFKSVGYEPFKQQWDYHNSPARFRVATCGRRFGKSTMSGRDAVPKHMLKPGRRIWIVGPCVDELTEIFTLRGWLRFDEVREGDVTLSINPVTGMSEWDTVQKVLRYPGEHRVVRMATQSFDAVSTGHHRWLSKTTNRQGPESGWVWRTTDTLRSTDRIPRAVPHSALPSEAKYSDDLVELLAWLWTEGSVVNGNNFRISQSRTANPDNVARIRRLSSLYYHEGITHDGTMSQFYIKGELVWPHLVRHKVVKPEFIRELTAAQLRLFVDTSILGDGRLNCIYQNDEEQLFAVQMAATLLGISTSLKRRGDGQYVLSLLTKTFASVRSMETQEHMYTGEVWCVSTSNKNWLARRRGSVYYTGNTYDLAEKEFRVIWNDLIIKKKFGKDKRVKKAYNKKQGDMRIELPWGTMVECRSAEHPDLLVGEALDHVIMSEAAKHKKETWDRFIRPSLADKRGTADFPTTPEGFNWLYELWGLGRDPSMPQYASWKFPSWYNTKIYPGGYQDEEIQLLLKTMDEEWFKQEIGADFASFVGKIFPDWDEFVHVREHKYNPLWKNYIAFDWGYTNPLAAVEFQVSPSDQIFVWRVYYKSYKTVPDVAKELKAQDQPAGYRIHMGFGDPADPEAVQMMTRELGVPVWAPTEIKSDYTWLDGIMLMRQFMSADREISVDEYGTPEYEPSFFVDPRCREVIKEFSNYRSKAPIKGANVPELGQKMQDHTIDALRYALLCIFKIGTAGALTDDLVGTGSVPELSRAAVAARAQEQNTALVGQGVPSVMDGLLMGSGSSGIFTQNQDF
jgi:hypothetical protein